MRMMRWIPVLTLGLLLPLGLAAQEEGQEGRGQATPPRAADPQLVFEREVFAYPQFERRNPFAALLANAGGGPRFESMRLEGIVYSASPQQSIAILSAGRARAASAEAVQTAGQTARLRIGERWGNVRIVEIRQNQIVVEVEEFGLTEQRIMDLPPRGQGGSR